VKTRKDETSGAKHLFLSFSRFLRLVI